MNNQIPRNKSALLAKEIEWYGQAYDEDAGLLVGVVGEQRYHSQLNPGTPIHALRTSANYAHALLESGAPEQITRAERILETLVSLQDTNPQNATYGIWPWYLEEPLHEMSQPDWNWADFIGVQFAQALHRNRPLLSARVREQALLSLRHAASCIARRDVGLDYTNIAIMGAYVTTMAGELLDDDDLRLYGHCRVRRFASFTEEWGGFPEYNSPTYTMVALAELARILRDFPPCEEREAVKQLYDRAWKDVATHWHTQSAQWAGPHSRSYSTLLLPKTLRLLNRALDDKLAPDVVDRFEPNPGEPLPESTLELRCPNHYAPFFFATRSDQTVRMQIQSGEAPLYGTTYLTEPYAISSVERGTFWNQSRALVAYARRETGPTAMHLRLLRDGYDFAAGNLIAVQSGPHVLGAVCLANDGGNIHCSFDRLDNKTIEASDWRLRFEFSGPVSVGHSPPPFSEENTLNIALGDSANMAIRIPWIRFGDEFPYWRIQTEAGKCFLDLVLYNDVSRPFVFDNTFPATIGIAIKMTDSEPCQEIGKIICTSSVEDISANWEYSPGQHLALRAPIVPLTEDQIVSWLSSSEISNGILVEDKS